MKQVVAAGSQLLTGFIHLIAPHAGTMSRSEACEKAGGELPYIKTVESLFNTWLI